MLFDANILLYAANHGSTAADQCQLTSTDVLPLRAEQVAGRWIYHEANETDDRVGEV